ALWMDQFFEIPTASKYATNGHIYVVPYDLVTTFFFYNKTIFQNAAVEPPTTYDQFLTVLQTIQESGAVPYNGMQWSQPQLGEMVLRRWTADFAATGAGGAYTQKDVTLAILAGIFDATKPEYRDWLRLMKESVPFWAQQWTQEEPELDRQFTQGNLGVYEDGSWRFGLLNANTELDFEWGSFFMPTLMPGTGVGLSEFADGAAPPAIGGATANQFGITNSAVNNNNVELCVDFLRYMTAPAQASEVIAELGQFLPNIQGVEVNQDLAPALEAVTTGIGEAGMIAYADKIDAEAADNIATATSNFLLDRTSIDDVVVEIQGLYMAQAEKVADEQGWR
ncbi:MAG: extracellular solute-binding protein, partial [Thermomicrobiales bacterium]